MTPAFSDRLDGVFAPRAVTIVGVSQNSATSMFVLGNLLGESGHAFAGTVNLVNRSTPTLRGLHAVASTDQVEGPPGLVFLFVASAECVAVLEGFTTLPDAVVVYAGGAESGNAATQEDLVSWALKNDVPLIGPQSTGVIALAASCVALATPFRTDLSPGGIGLVTQSAGLLGGVLNSLATRRVGIRTAVSIGNAALLGLPEFGRALLNDPEVRALGVYVDAIGSSQVLFDLTACAEQEQKPIVLAVGGISEAGKLAVLSHTGELATDRNVLDGLAKQCGIVLVQDADELIWSLEAIAATGFRRPREGGAAIYTTSGGGGIMMADVFDAARVPLAPVTDHVVQTLTAERAMTTCNPFDAGAAALGKAGEQRETLATLAGDPNISILVCASNIGLPPATGLAMYSGMVDMFVEVVQQAGKTAMVAATAAMGVQQNSALASWPGVCTAAGAKEAAVKVRSLLRWANGVAGQPLPVGVGPHPEPAADTTSASRHPQPVVVSGAQATQALARLGVRWPREVTVSTLAEADAALAVVGVPVVLKVEAGLAHRLKAGGVLQGLNDVAAARAGVRFLLSRFPRSRVAVIEAVDHDLDHEYVIGMQRSVEHGDLVMFGAGGSGVGDTVEFRRAPLTDEQARALVSGHTNDPTEITALSSAVLSFQGVIADLPGVESIDLNPVVVVAGDVYSLDAKLHMSRERRK